MSGRAVLEPPGRLSVLHLCELWHYRELLYVLSLGRRAGLGTCETPALDSSAGAGS